MIKVYWKSQSALPLAQAETLTPQWYAVQFHDESGPTNKFGIFDFSETEEGRYAISAIKILIFSKDMFIYTVDKLILTVKLLLLCSVKQRNFS